jgi:hypothetical protein
MERKPTAILQHQVLMMSEQAWTTKTILDEIAQSLNSSDKASETIFGAIEFTCGLARDLRAAAYCLELLERRDDDYDTTVEDPWEQFGNPLEKAKVALEREMTIRRLERERKAREEQESGERTAPALSIATIREENGPSAVQ